MYFLCCGSFGDVKGSATASTTVAKRNWRAVPATSIRGSLIRTYESDIEEVYYLDRDNELGKGGCGVVVIGEDKETHVQYAIKIVNKSTAERGRLDRELKLLKDVDHANIVRLFSVYESPSFMYFIMELCLGGHLGNLIARQPNKFLDEEWAKRLCKQILSAVSHIHSRGIAHRDIKLQNILIDCNNDKIAQIKLIDFGYGSKFVGNLPMKTKCGTPYTTAPEVIRENYDERCDVWSVGVVLYIMLSGRRPFEALDIGKFTQALVLLFYLFLSLLFVGGPLTDAGKAAMITNILAGRFHFNHRPFQVCSRNAVNFVKSLLSPDYRTRLRSHEALENPWLIEAPSKQNKPSPLLSAKSFRAVSKLKKSIDYTQMQRTGMVALVFGIQSKASMDLRAVFQSFDTDASGCISRKEFHTAMTKLAPDLTEEDVNKLFDIIDIDKNQQLSFSEFLIATLDPREVDIEELNNAFRILDEDGNGYITKDELRKVSCSVFTISFHFFLTGFFTFFIVVLSR
jgi:calcium-dependent protein kinase